MTPRARPRVLVVDDEPAIIDVLHEHFAKDCEVAFALDGAAGIEMVRTQRPDVINMPGVNGVDVLKIVKDLDPSIPVVMITANPENAVAADAIRRGAFSYLPKPFDLKYLNHLLAAALSRGLVM